MIKDSKKYFIVIRLKLTSRLNSSLFARRLEGRLFGGLESVIPLSGKQTLKKNPKAFREKSEKP